MYRYVTVDAESEENWGNLIKTWATGRSYFPAVEISKLPVPRSLDEIKHQCGLVGVNITIDPSMKTLTIIQHSPEAFTIRLPPKTMIEDAEKALREGTIDYALPHFYEVYCGDLQVGPGEERVRLQACRIGDYSLSVCQ